MGYCLAGSNIGPGIVISAINFKNLYQLSNFIKFTRIKCEICVLVKMAKPNTAVGPKQATGNR